MKLWLLRHGEAEPESARRFDAERRLTEYGELQARSSAGSLRGQPPFVVIASPYRRAQQTAAAVCGVLAYEQGIQTVPWLTPDNDPKTVIGKLDMFSGQDLLLVSHQPLLGKLAGLLIHGHGESPLPLSTGTLIELSGDMAAAGLMSLIAVHHPAA